jgi:hypothetical protein
MEVINNIDKTLGADLKKTLGKKARLSIAAAYFSIYAYQALKNELDQIEELRFIFTSPTFVADKGLTLKAVYENMLKSLISVNPGSNQALEQAVEKQKELDKLKREIGALEAKIAKERQFNRKVKYNLELQEKRKELVNLLSE